MNTELNLEDLRPQVIQQALQQMSSTVENPTECCIICLGNLTEQCEAQPCQHDNFDFICLVTWLQQRPTCPLCNNVVDEARYELSDDKKHGKIYKVPEPLEGLNNQSEEGGHRLPSRSAPQLHEAGAIQRRRYIYHHNLYSLHVDSNNRQPEESRYRQLSPQMFMTDLELIHRARKWLRRELRVFRFLNTSGNSPRELGSIDSPRSSNSEYLLEYILAILKNVNFQASSGAAEYMIQYVLGRKNTRLLLHEMKSWLRSPYTSLSAWDRNVQYHDQTLLPNVFPGTGTGTVSEFSITLKYHEPADARKPSPFQAWQLYAFKGDDILEVNELWERSVWLLGRDERIVDLVTAHPSCSGQHAALQFRHITEDHELTKEKELSQDVDKNCVGLYLIIYTALMARF